MPLCDFCFREKTPLSPVYPRTKANVCKACFYQIDRVIGFLRHSGIGLTVQQELPAAETSSNGTESKNRPIKKEQPDMDITKLL